jgi:hypothetical protein
MGPARSEHPAGILSILKQQIEIIYVFCLARFGMIVV